MIRYLCYDDGVIDAAFYQPKGLAKKTFHLNTRNRWV